MANRNFCLVERVAWAVIKLTEPKYSRELLGILPRDLSLTIITGGNMNQTIARVNRLQHEKEDALAKISSLGFGWEDKPEKRKKIRQMVDNFSDELNLTQEALQRQIKFLNVLSRSIYFLRFAKKETN